MQWRKAWAGVWDSVKYCSAACRRGRVGAIDRALEAAILELAQRRGATATLCPSEAARAVAPDGWRPLMERTRRAARRLCAEGRLEFLQRGRPVDPSTARGPVRLRLLPPRAD